MNSRKLKIIAGSSNPVLVTKIEIHEDVRGCQLPLPKGRGLSREV